MANHDIKIQLSGENAGWLIRNGSPAIDRIYANTRWANGAWRRALGQIKGALSPKTPVYFATIGNKARALGLPLELIPDPIRTTAIWRVR